MRNTRGQQRRAGCQAAPVRTGKGKATAPSKLLCASQKSPQQQSLNAIRGGDRRLARHRRPLSLPFSAPAVTPWRPSWIPLRPIGCEPPPPVPSRSWLDKKACQAMLHPLSHSPSFIPSLCPLFHRPAFSPFLDPISLSCPPFLCAPLQQPSSNILFSPPRSPFPSWPPHWPWRYLPSTSLLGWLNLSTGKEKEKSASYFFPLAALRYLPRFPTFCRVDGLRVYKKNEKKSPAKKTRQQQRAFLHHIQGQHSSYENG
jgi:hypothetical protein